MNQVVTATIRLNYSLQLNSLYSAVLGESNFYYEGTILDPNDPVRTALTQVKGNFRGYKYPNSYTLDKILKVEKEQRNT